MMKVQVARVSQSAGGAVRSLSARTSLNRNTRSTHALREQRVSNRVASSTTFVASAAPLALFSKCNFHSSKCTRDEAATSHRSNASSTKNTKPQPPLHSNSVSDRQVVAITDTVPAQTVEGIATVESLPASVDIKPPGLTNTSVSEAHFQHGFHLYSSGRVEDAVKALETALEYNHDHRHAHHYLGVALAKSGKHQQAVSHFLKSTKLAVPEDPMVQESWYQLGQSYIALRQFKLVVQAMDKMIKANPKDAAVHYNRGYALMILEVFDYAIRCLDVVLQLDPKHLSALQCKAYCFIQQKKYTQALELLDTAHQLNPNHATTLEYREFARKMFMRQKGVYSFDELFPASPERRDRLPVRFRRTLLPNVLFRPT